MSDDTSMQQTIHCPACDTEYNTLTYIVCPNCGATDGRRDFPDDMNRPLYCVDCETWHESDDRIEYDGPVRGWTYTMCPECGSKGDVEHPGLSGSELKVRDSDRQATTDSVDDQLTLEESLEGSGGFVGEDDSEDIND